MLVSLTVLIFAAYAAKGAFSNSSKLEGNIENSCGNMWNPFLEECLDQVGKDQIKSLVNLYLSELRVQRFNTLEFLRNY
jgi:hypothetical protein